MLLCLCSKNEPASVEQVLARGVTLLRSEHVTCSRVAPLLCKARAVAEMAAELELAQESLLFIDPPPTPTPTPTPTPQPYP